MAKNLEIKVKVDSLEKLKQLLENIGITQSEILIQKDIYYLIDTGRLKLRIENGKERLIYYNRDEADGEERFSNYELMEISSGNGESFLSKLYDVKIVVEKERELFFYNDTRIHLDKVKGLGEFIELETVVNVDEDFARKEFEYVNDLLGLENYEEFRGSYSDLLKAAK